MIPPTTRLTERLKNASELDDIGGEVYLFGAVETLQQQPLLPMLILLRALGAARQLIAGIQTKSQGMRLIPLVSISLIY